MQNLSVLLVDNKNEWEGFVGDHEESNFLQSWNWGIFHENLGKKIFRFGLYKSNKLIGIALAIKELARRGTYFTIAGGPIPFYGYETIFFINEIRKTAEKEKCDFIRMRPQELNSLDSRKLAKKLNLKPSPLYLTADLTLQLDLNQSDEEILRNMRRTTRYEIKKATKEGIEVKISQNPEDIKKFYDYEVTLAKRQHFIPFSYKFLYEQFKVFAKENQAALFHAYKNGELLASAFIIFYNNEAAYHYGISTPENRGLPGAYACQWAAILEAKNRGLGRYNFWGVAPQGARKHRFADLSIFKRGFGGNEVSYLPAHDLPISKKYPVIRTFEFLRKKLRKI
jgi:lipid II:glycine glycyltransferase (peptidoglycan interpeptide bridge formation enzyme)